MVDPASGTRNFNNPHVRFWWSKSGRVKVQPAVSQLSLSYHTIVSIVRPSTFVTDSAFPQSFTW